MIELKNKVKLTVYRFGEPQDFFYGSVKEAASHACYDVENNESCPSSIEEDGKVIWTNEGPFSDSYEQLKIFL
jgi:hypothetical protein